MMNKRNGITLIALVITIIVLLILAGVSINMIIGDDGIITKAKNSSLKTEQANLIEYLRMKIYEGKVNQLEGKMDYLQYLKNQNCIVEESNLDRINVFDLPISMNSGKGSAENGDIYYIISGNLYYYSSDKKEIDLGIIYPSVVPYSSTLDLFEYEDEDKTIIVGVKYSRKDGTGKYETELLLDAEGNILSSVIIPAKVKAINVELSKYDNIETFIIDGKKDWNDFEEVVDYNLINNRKSIFLCSEEYVFSFEDENYATIDGTPYKSQSVILDNNKNKISVWNLRDSNGEYVDVLMIPSTVKNIDISFSDFDNLDTIIVLGKNSAMDFDNLVGGYNIIFGDKNVIFLGE